MNQKSILKIFVFIIPLIFLLASNSFAQTGVLVGKIIDSQTGEALPGANVVIVGTSIGTASDIEGNYRIHAIPVGMYKVSFSYVGYMSDTVTVQIRNIDDKFRVFCSFQKLETNFF